MKGHSTVIDEVIINRAIRGDKEAFSVIVKGNGARALLVAERILRSPEEAIYAVTSLFVTAYRNLRKLKKIGFLDTWLMEILVRVCGERLKDGRSGPGIIEQPRLVEAASVPVVAGTASDAVSKRESRREILRRAVEALPLRERAGVMFRDWDGMGMLEIGEIFRCSQEDVRKVLVKARKTLAGALPPSQGLYGPGGDARDVELKENGKSRSRLRRRGQRRCGKDVDRLWLLVGGELGQREQVDLLLHMQDCADCRASLAVASAVLEEIRDAVAVEYDPPIAPERLWKEVEPLLL